MNEIYYGRRTRYGCLVTVDDRPLPLRLDLINRSPNGFEWGYLGSGPAQLALAILAYHCGSDEQRALRHYDEFKHLVIARIYSDSWLMNHRFVEQVLGVVESQYRKVEHRGLS
ncbi:MAG: DUF6166 domain-containing protein [Gammaproteobacteria bacterium]